MHSARLRDVTPTGRGGPRHNVDNPRGTSPIASTSTAAAGGGAVPRRGGGARAVTPVRKGNTIAEMFNLPSRHPPPPPPGPPLPPFKLTAMQELEVIERLERLEFIRGVGVEQFRPLPDGSIPDTNPQTATTIGGRAAPKPDIQQNLMGVFDSSAVGGPRDTMHSGEVREDSNSFESTGATGSTEDEDFSLKVDYSSYHELPEYITMVDKIMELMDQFYVLMERAVEAVFDAQFAELFPQQNLAALNQMENAMSILQNFLNEPQSENMKLFFPGPKKDQETIPCPVEKQDEFIDKAYKLSDVLAKMHNYLQSEKPDLDLSGKVNRFKELVDKLEKDLNDEQASMQTMDQYLQILKTVYGGNKDISATTSGSGDSGEILDLDY